MLLSIDAGEEARVLRRQGNSLLQNNQPAAALDCLERALQLAPGDALTLNDRGNALQDMQQRDHCTLFDTRTYCQHLENAYYGMLHENRRLDRVVS
jgi:regulator of sirC expression with transglutaminase-like and TPR domain